MLGKQCPSADTRGTTARALERRRLRVYTNSGSERGHTFREYHEAKGRRLLFEPAEGMTGLADVVAFLARFGVHVEKAERSGSSVEELYSSILEKIEQR